MGKDDQETMIFLQVQIGQPIMMRTADFGREAA